MGARKRIKADKMKEARKNIAFAKLNNCPTSPRKMRLIADLIRGMDAEKALAALTFSKRRVSNDVKKALQSAIANAENNHQLDVDRLFVKEAFVGEVFAAVDGP